MNKNIFVFDKPKNMTSNELVQLIKKKYNYKKVGHAGTLDPNATGVMVIGVNDGTKILGKLTIENKEYIATIKFGYATTTYDSEGEVTFITKNLVDIESIKKIVGFWLNQKDIKQIPPIYSAVKINGKKLYDYARKNIPITIPERTVQLLSADIIDFDKENQILKIKILVSKGFYVRSFANDLGITLNSCATLIELQRTKSGDFCIEQAIKI